jgi:hypothetical protein
MKTPHTHHLVYWEAMPTGICREMTYQGFHNATDCEQVISALVNEAKIRYEYFVFEGTRRNVNIHRTIAVRINGAILPVLNEV